MDVGLKNLILPTVGWNYCELSTLSWNAQPSAPYATCLNNLDTQCPPYYASRKDSTNTDCGSVAGAGTAPFTTTMTNDSAKNWAIKK